MNLVLMQVERLRNQLHKAEAWVAEKSDETKRARMERDASALELAALRKAHAALQERLS